MRISVPLLAAALPAALAQSNADPNLNFWAQLYDVAGCTGGKTKSYLGTMGGCVNIPLVGAGSAVLKRGQEKVTYLAGWTGEDCTGEVAVIEGAVGKCLNLHGLDIKSWSNDKRIFEGAQESVAKAKAAAGAQPAPVGLVPDTPVKGVH